MKIERIFIDSGWCKRYLERTDFLFRQVMGKDEVDATSSDADTAKSSMEPEALDPVQHRE